MVEIAQFKDFNFKLAVIERLMYEQGVLTPRFDVYDFVAAYTERQIDIEEEGYEIIPEVRAYFEQLAIPAELLPLIEAINQDGGDHIYGELCPFWDGEDDIFNIQSAEDAALLPNLKAVTLFYDSNPRILKNSASGGLRRSGCEDVTPGCQGAKAQRKNRKNSLRLSASASLR